MKPPVRPPRLRCGLFPSMSLPHLLVLPATFGLQRFQPPYPYFPALYVVSVRQVRGLPTASFRFHLTVNTLAVQLCASSLPTRTRDFHPLEPAHGGRTEKSRKPFDFLLGGAAGKRLVFSFENSGHDDPTTYYLLNEVVRNSDFCCVHFLITKELHQSFY